MTGKLIEIPEPEADITGQNTAGAVQQVVLRLAQPLQHEEFRARKIGL
jgi:hypothetical protein